MTTTTTDQARPPRIDYPIEIDCRDTVPYFQRTHYLDLHLYVHTIWRRSEFTEAAFTDIRRALTGALPDIYRKDYDPTRVTVGGLAEAHEVVCARVERGELS